MFDHLRRHPKTMFITGVLGLCALVAPLQTVFAQDADTPVLPEAVPGKECVTRARPFDFLNDLLLTPVSDVPYVAPTRVPDGVPLDPATEKEIRATVRQFIACSNSGEVLRALGMLDDEYLRRLFDPSGELDPDTANELLVTLATPTVTADEDLVIFIAIREMVLLPDGKVAVVIETDGGIPNDEGTDEDLFIFQKKDNNWVVIDALNDIDDVEAANTTPEAGT